MRLVRKDFDAAAEGFEEVQVPEPPALMLAPEGGLSGVPLEPGDQEATDQLEEQLGDVFVQAIRQEVKDAVREALNGGAGAAVLEVVTDDTNERYA